MHKKLLSLPAIPAVAAMHDLFLVISEARCAHFEHYPDEQTVTVSAHG